VSVTGCQKAGCRSDEVVFGHTLCPRHLKAISDLEHMQPLVERLDRRRRELEVFLKALEGPAADVDAAIKKLGDVIYAEQELRGARVSWFNTADQVMS
jgi:hypothetical protein